MNIAGSGSISEGLGVIIRELFAEDRSTLFSLGRERLQRNAAPRRCREGQALAHQSAALVQEIIQSYGFEGRKPPRAEHARGILTHPKEESEVKEGLRRMECDIWELEHP